MAWQIENSSYIMQTCGLWEFADHACGTCCVAYGDSLPDDFLATISGWVIMMPIKCVCAVLNILASLSSKVGVLLVYCIVFSFCVSVTKKVLQASAWACDISWMHY